jgi:hypothetical protein
VDRLGLLMESADAYRPPSEPTVAVVEIRDSKATDRHVSIASRRMERTHTTGDNMWS